MIATSTPLLESVEAIDASWLQRVLDEAGVTARVRDVLAQPIGHGTSSAVARLRIGYEGQAHGAPATLVAKFPKARTERSSAPAVVEGFAREVAAFRAFGSNGPFRIPRCYLADINDEGVFNLILEDLGDGCRPGDQIAGCSPGEAMAVARELAGLHCAWWNVRDLDRLAWPRRRAPIAARNAALYARGADEMRRRFAGRLGRDALAIIDAAVDLLEPWYVAAPAVSTLIHADPRVDNVIFEDRFAGVRACLIDWQSVAIGDPANDLAYFLTGSLAPEDRAACERDVVALHAATVRAAGIDYSD
ncbi:MAG TPA: phosphotransferase, partial [Sphingobium sp.]